MFTDVPHRRFDPLRGRWVLVSSGRDSRPWKGATEVAPPAVAARYDPGCHLCPGNQRAHGHRNPDYTGVYIFTNDFPALRPFSASSPFPAPHPDTGAGQGGIPAGEPHPLLRAEVEAGTCRVLCYSPRHDEALPTMSAPAVRAVVDMWAEQVRELERDWRWVQVFENRGAAMGASSPHPHGQVWASASLPDEPAAEDARQRAYLDRHGRPLLADYADMEEDAGERVVAAEGCWLAIVPFWAVWPFETLLVPRRPVTRLPDLTDGDRDDLVALLRRLLTAYDALFDHPFPYSMGWHGAPSSSPSSSPSRHRMGVASRAGDGKQDSAGHGDRHWQVHAHFYPPLLRSPTVRKFLVGYEMLAGVQRDITPEAAATRLRAGVPASLP